MAPPVPTECDHCHEPLAQALICSRCKGFAYCSDACQSAHWAVHRAGCSPFPKGVLCPQPVRRSPDLCEESEVVRHLVKETIIEWARNRVLVGTLGHQINPSQSPLDDLPHPYRLLLLLTPAFKQLAQHSIPTQLVRDNYPGRARPPRPNFTNQLTQLHRLLFLHDLAHLDPAQTDALVDSLDPASAWRSAQLERMEATGLMTHPLPGEAGARLHGPKVVAVPGELSRAEYAILARWMGPINMRVREVELSNPWMMLVQIGQQCALCPELLDYVPD